MAWHLGAGGRWFESSRPDHFAQVLPWRPVGRAPPCTLPICRPLTVAFKIEASRSARADRNVLPARFHQPDALNQLSRHSQQSGTCTWSKQERLTASRRSLDEIDLMDLISEPVDQTSSPQAKIALFRSLFRGREDVYPRRFENRKTAGLATRPRVPTSGSVACARNRASNVLNVRTVGSFRSRTTSFVGICLVATPRDNPSLPASPPCFRTRPASS